MTHSRIARTRTYVERDRSAPPAEAERAARADPVAALASLLDELDERAERGLRVDERDVVPRLPGRGASSITRWPSAFTRSSAAAQSSTR